MLLPQARTTPVALRNRVWLKPGEAERGWAHSGRHSPAHALTSSGLDDCGPSQRDGGWASDPSPERRITESELSFPVVAPPERGPIVQDGHEVLGADRDLAHGARQLHAQDVRPARLVHGG